MASDACNSIRAEMAKFLAIFEDIAHLLDSGVLGEDTVRTGFIANVGTLCSRAHIMDYISLYRSVNE